MRFILAFHIAARVLTLPKVKEKRMVLKPLTTHMYKTSTAVRYLAENI
jgi:hypothetical protein